MQNNRLGPKYLSYEVTAYYEIPVTVECTDDSRICSCLLEHVLQIKGTDCIVATVTLILD
jgi:hypothetical protein